MELKTFINPLLKWWWLIAIATIMAGATSFLASRDEPLTYQARTTLMIGNPIENPNPTGSQLSLGEQLAQAYVDIARREPVYNATKEALGLNRLPSYSINALPTTPFIEIRVIDTNPERSFLVATELANQVIRLGPSGLQQEEQERQDFINQQLNDLQAQIEGTKAEIEESQALLGDLISAQQIAETQSQIAALEAKRNTLQANFSALYNTQQGAINDITIIENASVPTFPLNSSKTTSIITAAAMGFVLATSAAFLLEYLDDSVKTQSDIRNATDLPTLGNIATIDLEDESTKPITIAHSRSPISEAFRILRTSIQFSRVDKPPRKILISSPNPGEGKTTIAVNLAIVTAQAGNKVLLVDADLRRPMLHTFFEVDPNPGLTELLLEANIADESEDLEVPIEKFIQKTEVPKLQVLTSGVIPNNPSEMLGSFRMRACLDLLAAQYDFLIIDSPPVLALADSLVLSAQIDGILLVASSNQTKRRELKLTAEKLREVDAPLLGVALNRASHKAEGYSSYLYYHNENHQEASITKRRVFNLNSLRSNGLLPHLNKEKKAELESENPI